MARLTKAPANDAPTGGLKVVTENGWFAARPSGTEDVYKLYAESFKGPTHLKLIQDEARAIVTAAAGSDEKLELASRNLHRVTVLPVTAVDPVSLVRHERVLATVGAVRMLEEKLA